MEIQEEVTPFHEILDDLHDNNIPVGTPRLKIRELPIHVPLNASIVLYDGKEIRPRHYDQCAVFQGDVGIEIRC
jgi:hypothetical protein